jgi:hypothetical protein
LALSPPRPIDKAELRDRILAQLREQLEVLAAAARSSRDEATDGENRQEGKFDMRAQSAAYLAAGQSQLADELAQAIAAYQALDISPLPPDSPAALGALVSLDFGGQISRILLGPGRGGLEVALGAETITVVTPASPLGRQLLGQKPGQDLGGRRRIQSVE